MPPAPRKILFSEASTFDQDIRQEEMTAAVEDDRNFVVANLRKSFSSLHWLIQKLLKARPKVIIENVTFVVRKGELLGLLGHNGAGKTTTMNMIIGVTSADSGNVYYNGHDLNSMQDVFRNNMGICPQHDILFEELTPAEHIELIGGIKLMSRKEIILATRNLLSLFKLTKVTHKKAGKFSGGMKRRLSLLLSTLGDPKIIMMDEPTTGMDPVNRCFVWKYIESIKQDRIIIMTTHSMEEAEFLSDKIVIMREGEICAVGNPAHLKGKLANGYRLTIQTAPMEEMAAFAYVKGFLPSATVENFKASEIIIVITKVDVPKMFNLVEFIDQDPNVQALITNWFISQMTLEDVFRKLSTTHYSCLEDFQQNQIDEAMKKQVKEAKKMKKTKKFWKRAKKDSTINMSFTPIEVPTLYGYNYGADANTMPSTFQFDPNALQQQQALQQQSNPNMAYQGQQQGFQPPFQQQQGFQPPLQQQQNFQPPFQQQQQNFQPPFQQQQQNFQPPFQQQQGFQPLSQQQGYQFSGSQPQYNSQQSMAPTKPEEPQNSNKNQDQ